MLWRNLGLAVAGLIASTLAHADTIAFTSVPAGYTSGSIDLGVPFAGALAADPSNPTVLYAAVGTYLNENIVRVDTASNTVTPVATGFGSIGGIAVPSTGNLVVTENATSETLLWLRDLNTDGDFFDAGEVTELIAPILMDTPGDFTGAQIAVAPGGNAANIPPGSLLVQTADGETSSELLVIENPLTSPAYRPTGGAFFSGFQYNGGVGFDVSGNVIMGEGRFDMMTFTSSGRIYALVNSNANDIIEAGEWNVLVDEPDLGSGLSDLSVSAENQVFFVEGSGNIRTFTLPANLLTGTATPSTFAGTNANYLSVCRFDDPTRTFAPSASPPRARLYVGGWAPSWTAATNLLWLEPAPAPASVGDWQLY